jgi:ABC-type nitrate/sulfonate/bicarbonate transport system permease component
MVQQNSSETAGSTKTPVRFRGGGFAPRPLRGIAALTFAAVLALWWVATAARWVSAFALPPPSEVLTALVTMIGDGSLAKHMAASLQRLLLGWSLGAAFGMMVGFGIGLSSLARSSALPLVSALFPIPKIALLPLFIIWLGIGEISKVATIAFGVFSPMAIATFGGVDNVDRNLIRMAQSFGVPTASIIRRIILPGAMPALLSGARISASIAIILLTAAEMIGAQFGIGAMVLAAGNLMQIDQLVAGVLVLSALGFTVSQLIGTVERRVLKWRT